MKKLLWASALSVLTTMATLDVRADDSKDGDWIMWGGTADRNMVSSMTDLPLEWDVNAGTNVKWVPALSRSVIS